MNQINLEITALSPLAIGRQKPGGSVSEAEKYIPGSVVRGAIAAEIMRQSSQPEANDDFHKLFLGNTPAIFHNAYPAVAKVGDESTVLTGDIVVLPATAVSSKTDSGFKPKKHGVFDTLIDRFCAEGYNHPYEPNCPVDGGRVEPYGGFYSLNDQHYYQPAISTRLLTRAGINRRRATTEEQVLYSIEVLNEVEGKNQAIPQGGLRFAIATYRGKILVEDEQLATSLCNFINSRNFWLGGAASRGLGKVDITATSSTKKADIASNIAEFNKELQNRWQMWQVFGKPDEDLLANRTYFTLDLQSDAILAEDWQRTTVISTAMLQQFAGVDDSSLQLHVAYTSYDYRSGWNAAWGLMKDVELITNKGAVYLFSTAQPELWIQALEHLQLQGVGERTSEGFGQLQVCNKFHLVFRERAA